MSDIKKFCEGMKNLREFIEKRKGKQTTVQRNSEQLNTVLERVEKEDFYI